MSGKVSSVPKQCQHITCTSCELDRITKCLPRAVPRVSEMDSDFANRQRFSGQCDTTECVEKVEAMLSTAILHQEDVWNMIVQNAPDGVSVDPLTGQTSTVAVDPKVLKAMKQKLQNSIDWCQLAQTRLKSLLSNQSQ